MADRRPARPPRILKASARRAPDPSTFVNPWDHGCLIRYLAWLRQAYGFLPLPSPKDGSAVGGGVPLLELFVQPQLTPLDKPAHEPWELLTVLGQQRQVALLGEPGSGRSTLIGWLVHALTDPGRNRVIDTIGRMVPIVFPLRVMPLDPQVRTIDGMLDQVRKMPFWYDGMDGVLEMLLARGQALFVLDDMDLVAGPGIGEAVHEAIIDGVFQHASSVWVLASTVERWRQRPVRMDALGAEALPASLAGLKHDNGPRIPAWTLQPFSDQQVRGYAHRWLAQADLEDEQRIAAAEQLARSISTHDQARRLAERPGMLALLGLVYTASGQIPADRASLHDWLVAAWIAILDEAPGAGHVAADARRAWVEAMARQAEAMRVQALHRREAFGRSGDPLPPTPVIAFRDAVGLVRQAAAQTGRPLDEAEATRFVAGASVRPGILVARAGGLAFARPDQQRFLAAVHLAADLQEVTEGQADDALQTLKGWSRTAAAREDLVELFEVLAEQPGLAEKVYKQLLGRSKARTLGELDDLGPLALALRDGGRGIPSRVQGAAGRLVQEAVHRWARERKRVPPWAPDLTPLAALTDLPSLDLSGCQRVTDLGPLAGLRRLQRLDLHGCRQVTDLTPLQHLQSLQWADCRGLDQVRDLDPVGRIDGLRWLDLGGCTALTDLAPLTRLSNLQALVLHGCTGVEDLSPLTALRSLRALVISGCTGIFDLSPLRMLPRGGRVWVRGSSVRIVPPDLDWDVVGL